MDGGFGGDEELGFPGDDDLDVDGVDEPMRGWIPPDARVWRHPSEMGPGGDALVGDDLVGMASGRARRRSRWWITGTVSIAAGSVAAMGLMLADSGASPGTLVRSPAAATVTSTTMAVSGASGGSPNPAMVAAAAHVTPSIVPLESSNGTTATGLAVDTGGVVVAPMSLIAGNATVWSTDRNRQRHRATVVASDPGTGLALLAVAGDHPIAPFADQDDLTAGAPAVEVAWPGGTSVPSSAPTTVLSTGTAVRLDAVTASLATTAVPGGTPSAAGCVLVDAAGRVAGVEHLAAPVGGHMVSVFLPGYLVLEVARQLVATGTVEHGWLGASVSTALAPAHTTASAATVSLETDTSPPASGGVVVTSVVPGGAAAAAGLQTGDVITAVDGQPVRSPAELRDHLYGEPPGTSVSLTYVDGGLSGTTVAVLTAPPAGVTSSP